MTNQLKWRLGKLPTPDEVLKLVNDKLITKEEARDILFKEEEIEEISISSLKDEIKFLRELITKLGNRTQIIESIRYIEKPYIQWGWYQPYQYWCAGGTPIMNGTANRLTGTSGPTISNAMYVGTTGSSGTATLSASSHLLTTNASFKDITTF